MGGGGGESGSGGLSSSAPNMVGDLLGAGRSVSFIIGRERGPVFIEATGATNIVNPKVADNNSPIPRDRLGFRFNYFNNATSITGLASETVFAPERSLNGFIRPTRTRDYDYHLYTFNWEQTFLDGLASFELRLPIRTSLASELNYSVGTVQGSGRFRDAGNLPVYYNPRTGQYRVFPGLPNLAASDAQAAALGLTPLSALNVNATPEETLGRTKTELGDLSLILKGLLYQDRQFALSSGVSVTAPTSRDTRVRVTDFLGPKEFNNVDTLRVRDFQVSRNTWGVSPFAAALWASPDSPLFVQGFAQLDVPVGEDRVRLTETTPIALNPILPARDPNDPRTNVLVPPFTATSRVRDQVLMHLDVGVGYWLLRDSSRTWLTGLAPTVELHYTTTLNNARLATLPNDPSVIGVPTGQGGFNAEGVLVPRVTDVFPAAPTVGNTRNRMDIVNLTLGTTMVIADQATVATAFALPLRGGDNRTFDWEFQLQLNWFFGAPRGGTPVPPMAR